MNARFFSRRGAIAALCWLGFAFGGAAAQTGGANVAIQGKPLIILGDDPGIVIEGFAPRQDFIVHGVRRLNPAAGATDPEPTFLHAWARLRADRKGRAEIARLKPREGSYSSADQNGLLWSGYKTGDPALKAVRPLAQLGALPENGRQFLVAVEVGSAILAQRTFEIRSYGADVAFTDVSAADAGVAGVLAAPKNARGGPTLILLHGSEGASPAAARVWAGRMAERGFTAFALSYVAYPWASPIPGVAEAFVNIPIETIEKARNYLATRPEADVSRLGVIGASKGAEFSLLAATRYPWIKAVVACVPSDVVWAGFGAPPPPGVANSSWSWQGAPLPAIDYDRYDDVFSGKATAREVHQRSRDRATAETLAQSRIPVEQIKGQVLLIGGGVDDVWPSLEMAQSVRARMRSAGLGARVEALLYPQASHNLCGVGASPQRLGETKFPEAEAIANGEAFRASLAFLNNALSD